jgi:hypothetical protein
MGQMTYILWVFNVFSSYQEDFSGHNKLIQG